MFIIAILVGKNSISVARLSLGRAKGNVVPTVEVHIGMGFA